MKKRDEYVQKMKSQLDALNATMNELEAKAKDVKQEARAKYREEVASLRHQSKVAAAKLEDLKFAGEDRWEAMVAEMDKLRDAVVHSFHYFKSQI
jgi:predicted  nucleic acid-binding Zn-ribbon protein